MDVQRSRRLSELPPFMYAEIRRRISEAQARGIEVISLGIGNPDAPTPPHIVDALARAATEPVNQKYPPGFSHGLMAYREAVAAWYKHRFGVVVDPATEVLALIGSKEGVHHLALGVLDPGTLALVPDPGYPTYESSVILAGATCRRLPLPAADGFLPDLDSIPPADAAAARLAWLNYPNNPTAAVAPPDFLRRAIEFGHRHQVLLVNDNPYSEISFDGERTHSILEVDGAKDVAVEFISLSKTYSMAGFRIGAAVGNASALAAMAQVKENTDAGIFAAVQHAGIAALQGPQTTIAENNVTYQRRRDRVVDSLRRIGLHVEPPKATLYVWAKLPEGEDSTSFASRLLDLSGVAVTPGVGYGTLGEGYVRISLVVPDDRLHEALLRIEKVADRLFPHRTDR